MIEYWCARCCKVYAWQYGPEWSLLFWLYEHKYEGRPAAGVPKCPTAPTYDDITDLTLRRLGQMPGGQLGGTQ